MAPNLSGVNAGATLPHEGRMAAKSALRALCTSPAKTIAQVVVTMAKRQ
jgi:hypothetical protein